MRKTLLLESISTLLLWTLLTQAGSVGDEISVEALVDGSARLPCHLLPKKDESVEFIFWYKNDGVTALYTLDARDRKLSDATHMRNETYSERVHFHVGASKGEPPFLQMDDLLEDDSGSYFCRVDYQWSATELNRVDLVVVVPPKSLTIRDDQEQDVHEIAGPYRERTDVSLICEAVKGFPTPNVTWWRDNTLWDNTFHRVGEDSVVNEMRLTNLSRSELLATFQCKAQNTQLTPPVIRKLVLDLHLYPTSVQILGKNMALSESRPIELQCESSGSRPPAHLSWWLNGTRLQDHSESTLDDRTSSKLRFRPKRLHHRLPLACRARNPALPDSTLEDARLLNVTYLPQVNLRLIKEESDRMPREDDFVRLTCDADANPPVLKMGWLLDGQPLASNESRFDLASSSTLVFKRLARRNRGRYSCYAINDEGRGSSRELQLNISHAPVCKENQQVTYSVALNESVSVRCEVEALPPDVTFKWEFSNTVHKHYRIQHRAEGPVSLATYVPHTLADYGTLFCWANNSVGLQQSSCFFTVIAAACKNEKATVNASTSSKDGGDDVWFHSALTAGAAACIVLAAALCAFCVRKVYIKKKHRPVGLQQQMLDEEVSIYSRVQCHNVGPQPRILIAK